MRVQVGGEVGRGVVELGHDPVVDIGNQPAADFVQDRLFQPRAGLVPVDRHLAHMGDRHQRVEGALALWGHRGIGDARVVQIDGEILRQHAVGIDIVQQAFVARAEQDHMVRDARPGAFQPEMHDEQARAERLAAQRFRVGLAALAGAQQVAIGMHDVGIAGDRVEILAPAALRLDRLGPFRAARFLDMDLHHRVAQADGAAQPLEMANHAGDQAVGAAARPPHAAILLQLVNQRVDGAGLHRIAADQQGVEAQRLAQLLALHVFADDRIDAAPRLLFRQRGGGLDHAFEVQERHRAQLQIAFFVTALGIFQEALVALPVARLRLPLDLVAKLLLVVGVIEIGAVGPVEAVEGMDLHQLHVLRHVVPGQLPQLLQAGRIGDDGGAGVEGEAVALPVVAAAAGLVPPFHHGGLDAGGLQPDRQRQPAEARADHAGALAFGGKGRGGGFAEVCGGVHDVILL